MGPCRRREARDEEDAPVRGSRLLLAAGVLTVCLAAPAALVAAQEPAPAAAPGQATNGRPPAPPAANPPPAEGTPAPSPSPPPPQGAPDDGTPAPDESITPPAHSTPPPAGSSTFVSAASSASVSILDGNSQSAFRFSPGSITIGVGETVTWTNKGNAPHNVTGDGLGSPTLNNGQSYSHRFTSPGTVSYICSIHPFMKGTVTVQGTSSGGGGSGSSGSTGSSPTTGGSTGSGSESQAVTSPDAAGTSTQLPSTGMPVLPLLIGGVALLLAGALLRRETSAT